eukprot:scaffold4475_cov277-Chaetoceros_neogracile.AAC.11
MESSDTCAYKLCAYLHNVCVKENRREQQFIRFQRKGIRTSGVQEGRVKGGCSEEENDFERR